MRPILKLEWYQSKMKTLARCSAHVFYQNKVCLPVGLQAEVSKEDKSVPRFLVRPYLRRTAWYLHYACGEPFTTLVQLPHLITVGVHV